MAADSEGNFLVVWMSWDALCNVEPCSDQDGSGVGIFGRRVTLPLFADDFESGQVCDWSEQSGSGDACA